MVLDFSSRINVAGVLSKEISSEKEKSSLGSK